MKKKKSRWAQPGHGHTMKSESSLARSMCVDVRPCDVDLESLRCTTQVSNIAQQRPSRNFQLPMCGFPMTEGKSLGVVCLHGG